MPQYNIRKLAIFENRFNLVNAGENLLIPFIESLINNPDRPSCLYICGIYPRILPRLYRENPFFLRRAANPYQILKILSDAEQQLIIIEHDPSVFDEFSDVAEEIGKRCIEISNNSTIIYFWPYPDRVIRNYIERYADRITHIIRDKTAKKRLKTRFSDSGQTTLERNW